VQASFCSRCVAVWLFAVLSACSGAFAADFQISPARVTFDRSFEQAQLLVTAVDSTGTVTERSDDFDGSGHVTTSNPAVVGVTPGGRCWEWATARHRLSHGRWGFQVDRGPC